MKERVAIDDSLGVLRVFVRFNPHVGGLSPKFRVPPSRKIESVEICPTSVDKMSGRLIQNRLPQKAHEAQDLIIHR